MIDPRELLARIAPSPPGPGLLRSSLAVLACPSCHGELALRLSVRDAGGEEERVKDSALSCARCGREYRVKDGTPRFIEPEELTGQNRRFARLYDWFSYVYRPFSRAAFAFLGGEERNRREVVDRLELGERVLEVSIGPGVNLPYLCGAPGVREVWGLDISEGQLERCRAYAAREGYAVNLVLGNAEALPFKDDTFDAVLHVGGINFFNDRKKAIEEMIRVAKPGTRIVIVDEVERGAKVYEWTLPGFLRGFEGPRPEVVAPIDLVPPEMEEIRFDKAWKGWFYLIEFRKPAAR